MLADLDPELVQRYARPHTRAAPVLSRFGPFSSEQHLLAVKRSNTATPTAPLSVYLRAPRVDDSARCESCEARPGQGGADPASYLRALLREIELQAQPFARRRPVEQLHVSAVLAAMMDDDQIESLLRAIEVAFGWVKPEQRSFNITLDVTRICASRLQRLCAMGFHHVVLRAPASRSTGAARVAVAALERVLDDARRCGFHSVAAELETGAPQGEAADPGITLGQLVAARPDRISLRSVSGAYPPAPVPAAAPIAASFANDLLVAEGYVHLGLDQFALPDDALALAFEQDRLRWGLQGYATHAVLDTLGLGSDGVSRIGSVYSRNQACSACYQATIESGRLAVSSGRVLSPDDQLRAAVIERILCGREIRYAWLRARHGIDFREHFRTELTRLVQAERDGLVKRLPDRLSIGAHGRYFLPVLAQAFDTEDDAAPVPGSIHRDAAAGARATDS